MAKKLPPVSTKGYRLAGDGLRVVLFHGFTGSPYDLKPLALYLHKHGCDISVPLLYGHGTQSSDLSGISALDWLEQAKLELDQVKNHRPLILGGLSMGALIAIIMAKANNPQALILLSPALHLSFGTELTIVGVKLGILPADQAFPKFGGKSDINDPVAKKKCPSYAEMPLHGLVQLAKLCHQARLDLTSIKCPLFAAFGQQDSAIDVGASHRAIIALATGPINAKIYGRSKHVVSLDYDRDLLAHDVWQFLTTYRRS